jgi:hypothetical protein
MTVEHYGHNMPQAPTPEYFDAGRVTNPDQSEIIRQRLYDYLLYPAAGQAQLQFFNFAIGQGVTTALGAVVGSTKTQWDTNMTLAGQLPSGKQYLVQGIEVYFFPGSSAAANTYIPAPPNLFAVAAAASVAAAAADVNTFYQSGRLQFQILDKFVMDETPLITFPVQTAIGADVSLASNSATVGEMGVLLARCIGRPYVMNIPVTIQPAMNFSLNMIWPAAVAMPSTFNGRVGVVLDGYFERASQ